MGWDVGVFLAVVFMPALLSIILALAFFWRHTPLMVSVLISILIIAIVAIPITDNGKKMIRDHPNLDKSKLIFYPFSAFSDQFHYIPDMQIYVSRATWGDMGVGQFAKDPNEVASLFNIYFDSKSTKDNFTISTGLLNISYDLLSSNYTDALLSLEDWQTIASNLQTKSQLEQKYLVLFENQNRIVFLKAR
jgi:hypothetical protein